MKDLVGSFASGGRSRQTLPVAPRFLLATAADTARITPHVTGNGDLRWMLRRIGRLTAESVKVSAAQKKKDNSSAASLLAYVFGDVTTMIAIHRYPFRPCVFVSAESNSGTREATLCR